MSKISVLMLGAAILSGCATKEMKSTPFYEGDQVTYVGEVSDRVNLWPVAYWRNPVGAVLWPVTSFSDDHFAFRPVYSQYKQDGKDGAWDEFNFVWPIAQADTKHDDYRVFPVFWGWDNQGRGYQAVFPIYWNGPTYNSLFPIWYYGSTTNSWNFNTLAGLAGAGQSETGYRSSWAFPLWYEDNTGLFTTLIYGQTKNSHWVFPLWYNGEKAFVSPLYAQGMDGDKSWWSVPLGLSWGKDSSGVKSRKSEGMILLGCGGWESVVRTNGCRNVHWWAFPFVQRETWTNDKGRQTTETRAACCLCGWETRGDTLARLYAFPLFSWDEDGSWLTLMGGQTNCRGTTNTVITPLVSITSGRQTGGWVFPLWSHKKDVDFGEKVALVDAPTLPDCIKVSVETNSCKHDASLNQTRLYGKAFWSDDRTCVLLHDADHFVYGQTFGWFGAVTNGYVITERYNRGNQLLLDYTSRREVSFDLKTRTKLSDKEVSESNFLLFLYQYDWTRDRMNGDEFTRHRVLWRLWDWEEQNGDVALDIFPGFTYDSRTDGYTKISFLWRFFRHEYDPKEGRKIDFLFIPIWR